MEFMDSWILIHDHSANVKTIFEHHHTSYHPEEETIVDTFSVEMESVDLHSASEDQLVYRHPFWVIVVLVVGYMCVLIFGLLGNFSVLIVVARTPRMSTVTNLFICNLAVADLLVLIFCILPNLVSNIFVPWVLGTLLCKIVPYVQGVSVCASIYSLVAISAERCLAIQYPLHTQLTKTTARSVIICIWIWSLTVAAPWAIFFKLQAADPTQPDLNFCIEVWPEGFEYETYYFFFANLILCYLFPLSIISLCYFIIWLKVWRRPLLSDLSSRNSAIELIHQKAKAGVLKMLIVVVLMFALSWLPLYLIFSRIKLYGTPLSEVEIEIIDIGTPLAQWLGNSNSMWNPWTYAFLNVKFRRAFNFLFFGKQWMRREPTPNFQKPNVNIMLKRLNKITTKTSLFNVTEV